MRTAFIIISIFAAVVLLVRFAAPPAKPTFISGERITQSALINNIRALGKKCAVTENGLGISQAVNIRHIIYECKKRVKNNAADDWQNLLCNASDTVYRALSDGKKSARYSQYCAHVGKFPRVYLFCEMLVRQSDCEITHGLLLNCISAFEENAQFTQSERKILCGMLKFCLIGNLNAVAETGLKRAEMFDKGMSDGNAESVDLTYIRVDDYICGLIEACADNAVVRLFECNGVDINVASKNRRKFLAQAYVTVNSVLRSLIVADECEGEIFAPKKHGMRAERYVKAFNILFPILLAVYAVFTCIFASPKYVALFSIAAILTYGVMRIPVLIYSPEGGINIFAPIESFLRRRFNRKTNVQLYDNDRQLLSETAYFGCEPQYLESVIEGCINVRCDNRGGITICSGESSDLLYISIISDGVTASLSECDGVIERHRATYRVCKSEIELCAKVLVPIDVSACIVELTVINRSDTDKTVNITGAVVRNAVAEDCITEDIYGGAMANCNDGFALSVADGKYGGDLSAFCADGSLRHARTNKPALIGMSDVNVKSFSRVCLYVTVAYAKSRTEAESLLRYVSDELFYSRAAVGASVYCGLNKSNKLPEAHGMYADVREQIQVAKYPSPKLSEPELLYKLPFGGITENNDMLVSDNHYKTINNTLTNGKISLTLNQFGLQNIAFDGLSVTSPPDDYLHTPRAFVVFGENGVIWSPTGRRHSEETYVVHGRGYTEYTYAYNGTVCSQKCFVVKSAVIIDVTLCNKTNAERKIDIMFSALCNSGTSVVFTDNGVTANNLLLCVLQDHAEYALYKEGYFIYGHIARTSGFRFGGSTPAPTASVCKTIKPKASARVVFCITDSACELPNISDVDDLFDNVKGFYKKLGRIYPKTDDGVLNFSYIQALYSAYTAFVSRKNMSLFDESLVMSAVKYAAPSAVKNRIYEILSCQNENGELSDYTACLQFLCCATEYSQFINDSEFWNEILPYAVRGKRVVIKDAVYNHVLRAVKYLIINPAPKTESLVLSIWNNKNLISILGFWEDRIKDDSLIAASKKRLAIAVDTYSRQVKRLISNNFFEFNSLTEAYMCAKLLFDLDLNEKAYNIIKYNNPIERCLHYGNRAENEFDYYSDPVASAVYFTTVTERLFGVKFRGKTVKVCPHTAPNTPKLSFDIYGKTKDIHITVDDTDYCGSWRMRADRINYPADSVDIGERGGDITFFRGGQT